MTNGLTLYSITALSSMTEIGESHTSATIPHYASCMELHHSQYNYKKIYPSMSYCIQGDVKLILYLIASVDNRIMVASPLNSLHVWLWSVILMFTPTSYDSSTNSYCKFTYISIIINILNVGHIWTDRYHDFWNGRVLVPITYYAVFFQLLFFLLSVVWCLYLTIFTMTK